MQKKELQISMEKLEALSGLSLSEKERESISAWFPLMLDWMQKLGDMKTEALFPQGDILFLREDRAVPFPHGESLLACTKEKKDGYFIVPQIIGPREEK